MIDALSQGQTSSAGELGRQFRSAQPTISKHLKVLEQAGRHCHANRSELIILAVSRCRSSPLYRDGRILPRLRCGRPEQAKRAAGRELALELERVVDRRMLAEKTLARSGRIETLTFVLFVGPGARVLGPIVLAHALLIPG